MRKYIIKVQVRQTEMTAAEKEYVWMKNLSDTANGKLNGKAKIEAGNLYPDGHILTGILRRRQSPSYEHDVAVSTN